MAANRITQNEQQSDYCIGEDCAWYAGVWDVEQNHVCAVAKIAANLLGRSSQK